MEDNILEIRSLSKAFEGVMAVDHVSFSVRRGEVHALMGENAVGNGKLVAQLGEFVGHGTILVVRKRAMPAGCQPYRPLAQQTCRRR